MSPNDVITFNIEPRGEVDNTDTFVSALFKLRNSISDKKLWYRGHSDASYELIPSVGRDHSYAGKTMDLSREAESRLLHRFRRRAYPHVDRAMTAGEAIFLARHHKLPTRLLDWTANALYSLYFACVENHSKDGKLWAMLRRKDSIDVDVFSLAKTASEEELFNRPIMDGISSISKDHPSDEYAIKIVHPFYNSPRLLAQDGAFTFHSNPWTRVEWYEEKPFMKKNLDIQKLYYWRIPAGRKVPIIEQLSGLGITERIMFPDLDGIAKSLWETEVLWHGQPNHE